MDLMFLISNSIKALGKNTHQNLDKKCALRTGQSLKRKTEQSSDKKYALRTDPSLERKTCQNSGKKYTLEKKQRFDRYASRSVLFRPCASRSVLHSSHTYKFISCNLILKLKSILYNIVDVKYIFSKLLNLFFILIENGNINIKYLKKKKNS